MYAINELKKYVKVPENRVEKYFLEIDEFATQNIEKYLKHETKIIEFFGKKTTITQLEMRDSLKFIKSNTEKLKNIMKSFGNNERFLTSPSVNIGKNYILTESEEIKKLFIEHFDTVFDGDIGETKLLWMRKEILKIFREKVEFSEIT